jgi:drug/metabolite transporter (DMT)-like permease
MSDSDIHEKRRPALPDPYDVDVQSGRYDSRGPGSGFSGAVQWGLASLLIGCTLLIAACVLLVFNVVLFRAGPAGIPTALAFAAGLIGALVVCALSVASVLFGIWGWQEAQAERASAGLSVAGITVSFVGSITWLIAAIDLNMILGGFLGR